MSSLLKFLEFLNEEFLNEAKNDDPTKIGGVSNDTKGVLHELLVGKNLNGGEHMARHPNINRETPKQAHDRLKKQIHPGDYKRILKRANSAAEDIRNNLGNTHRGHKIKGVSWTSKSGDTENVTGVAATQKEDASDIYVTTHHPRHGTTHHGISLKVTDKSDKNVPGSNLGMESAGSKARELYNEHQERVKSMFSAITKVKKQSHHKDIADARKEWGEKNPKKLEKIKQMNRQLLQRVAHHHAAELQEKLRSGQHEEVIKHIRNVLAAKVTPAQVAGKATFQKHTSYETARGTRHHTTDPGTAHEHILKNHQHIEVEASGANVHFYHRDPETGERTKFASQSHKLDSQRDPLSVLKSAGKATG